MPEQIREYVIGEFRGSFPDVPIAAGVNMDEIKTIDPEPIFVTLPIIPEIGMVSKNGLLYDEALANNVEEQINIKRPGGIYGHLSNVNRDTDFPYPVGIWVGAKRVGKSLWAKAYMMPGEARNHVRMLKATGGSIATSIYGTGAYEAVREGVRRLKDFNLESLDFAPPERAALGYGAAPIVTSEFAQAPAGRAEEIRNMTMVTVKDVPQALAEQIIQEFVQRNGRRDDVAELTQQVTDRDAIIAELRTSVQASLVREFDTVLDTEIAKLINWQVKGEAAQAKVDAFKRTLRSRIVAEMGAERKAERIATVVAEVWKDLQPIAETLRDALAGPPAIVGSHRRGQVAKFEDTPEARQRARAQFGF